MIRRLRHTLLVMGLTRSSLLRRMVHLGHPRLRRLRARALTEQGATALALRGAVRVLERGVLRVPQGHGVGILLDMNQLPISHAHFGSLAFGNLETSVQEAMLRHLGPGGVFYDIGANLGFFALLGARLVGDSGRVYAFEAAPDNARAIERNVELNHARNVEVIDKAVAAAPGRGSLQVVDDQSWSKLAELGEHPFTEQIISVELVSIDALVGEGTVRPPTVVKIDVEGAEIDVIEGMRETIRVHQPAIICELHETHAQFVAAMDEHGYRLVNIEGTIPVEQEGASAHVLALPPLHPGD